MDFALDALGVRNRAALARRAGLREAQSLLAALRRGSAHSEYFEPVLSLLPDHLVSHSWVRLGEGRGFPRPQKQATAFDFDSEASPTTTEAPAASSQSPSLSIPPIALKTTFSGGTKLEVCPDLSGERREFGALRSPSTGGSAGSLVFAEMPDGSMSPYLMPGEAFALNYRDTAPEEGKLYCLWRAGQLTVRKAQCKGDSVVLLVSPIEAKDVIDLAESANVQVLGRVVGRAGAEL
ncbi:hypothetical protein E5P1_00832 (plasmid) [Variovorax sp. PBL-E5]|nr:hypothetical protein E5P1_00832 [Variovorax sp. PBL-E5]